jgi:Caspase domain
MENWAIVIGVDRYWTEQASLKGAVADALRMRDWLLDPAGGDVPEKNVALALSPLPGNEPAGLNHVEATTTNVINLIADLFQRSKGEGERLYFFYAGHGLTARVNQRDESTLVADDFGPNTPNNSLALRSLWEFFETTRFKDQFLFVDACRNIPWEGVEFEVGRWPRPRQRDPGSPPTQQFILYATSPGLKARELREVGNERGAFTEVLLAGLRGAGTAKAWSAETQDYQVRWERLVDHVKGQLEERRYAVGAGPAQDVFQIPQDSGARGVAGRERNPILAHFPSGAFPPERLTVDLKPRAVHAAEVIVLDESAEPIEAKPQIAGAPVEFSLPPRTYALHATAPQYAKAVRRPPVDLYGAVEIPLELLRAPEGTAAPTNGGVAAPSPGAAGTGELRVHCSDPLGPLEIADAAGAVVVVGTGEIAGALTAGFYRARLCLPGAAVVEQSVELTPGVSQTVELEPPAAPPGPVVRDVLQKIGAEVGPDNTIDVSKVTGPIASPHLSTILTLAGGVAAHDPGYGRQLRRLGLKAFKQSIPSGCKSGLYLLLGADAKDTKQADQIISGLRLRTWALGEPVPKARERPSKVAKLPGIGEFGTGAAVGPHWLSVEVEGDRPAVFALAQLPRRFTMITLVLEGNQARAYQYLPSLSPDESTHPRELRRIELLQRLLLSGSLEAGIDEARELMRAKELDPLAGCVGAYIFLRQGRVKELRTVVGKLVRLYPELSDCHVLKGEYEAAAGHEAAARKAFAEAIEAGVPIFGEGLTRLLEGLRTYELDHPRAKVVDAVFRNHLSGSMWSVWTPEKLDAGKVLVA